MVTAELAFALPLLVLVTSALLWALGLGVAQAQLIHASREGARAAARGESVSGIEAAVRLAVPAAVVTVSRTPSGLVSVSAEVDREPSPRLLRPLGAHLRATSTTAPEQG